MSEVLMSTYSRLPVTFTRGAGAWLWDTEGRRYLDALSGIGVCGLGHAHPAVAAALCEQAATLVHTSNLYGVALQEELAARLARLSGMERAFFCNSGAEAVEAAIKLARLHGHKRGVAQPAIVVAQNSFHGRTLATLSASGNRKVQAGFEPLVGGFVRVAYDDIDALHTVARNTPNAVAVLIEPIQGEGGVVVPGADYLPRLRALCDEYQWLLMLDEIQTGLGRTGRWFAHQHHDVAPDVLILAKGLANGVPIGACLARGAAAAVFHPGSHGSTFGGNPLACRAALAVLETLGAGRLDERAAELGARLQTALRARLAAVAAVREIRGKGLMIGIELDRPCRELSRAALERGVLVSIQAENVVRLLPPLIISDAEADEIATRVADAVVAYLGAPD